jgi:hypothetical protein
MRTTVDLPDDLFRIAKAYAAQRGERLKDLFIRAIAHEVGSRPVQHRMGTRVTLPLVGRDTEPAVSVSDADIEAALTADDTERYGGG